MSKKFIAIIQDSDEEPVIPPKEKPNSSKNATIDLTLDSDDEGVAQPKEKRLPLTTSNQNKKRARQDSITEETGTKRKKAKVSGVQNKTSKNTKPPKAKLGLATVNNPSHNPSRESDTGSQFDADSASESDSDHSEGVEEEEIDGANKNGKRTAKKRGKQSGPRDDGVRAKGEPHSSERKAQLEELQEEDTFAEELGKKPPVIWKGRRPNDPNFLREFLKAKLGLSLLRSANGFGTTESAVKTRQEEGQRIAQWNKKKAVDDRRAEAERFNGDWAAAEQFKKIVSTISSIVRDQTSFNFQSSPRLGECKACGALVLGKDRNATHHCPVESKEIAISITTCRNYEWIAHLHDILDHSELSDDARDAALDELGYTARLARRLLVDGQGTVDPIIPFSFEPKRVHGLIYFKTDGSTDPHLRLLMAWDVALKSECRGIDPLDVAENAGKVIGPDAREKYDQKKTDYWSERFIKNVLRVLEENRQVKAIICIRCGDFKIRAYDDPWSKFTKHSPCNLKADSGSRLANYYAYRIRSFVDLPYSIARVLLYHAFRSGNRNSALAKKILAWKSK
ncbi:hypothetical protein CPB86DRAFT_785170 [Serendipita vermifera]|nr:hypothetical protein CPB86DRAFT_785170 [Serendipita vermifera]